MIANDAMIMVGRGGDDSERKGGSSSSWARLPEDTVSLSYWVSRRLPISDHDKLSLLSIHCPTLRLVQALLILQVPPSLPPSLALNSFSLFPVYFS